jgi:hypothetical protein
VNEESLIYIGRYKPRTEKIDYDRILDEYNQMMRESQDYAELYFLFNDPADKEYSDNMYRMAIAFMDEIKNKYSGDTYENLKIN